MWQQAVAEFVGAFALVFIGAGSIISLAGLGADAALVGVALAHGLVIAVMVTAVGHISGGHFNPAVTVGAWVAGKIETMRVVVYIVAQLAGAIFGALLLRLALPENLWKATSMGTPTVNESFLTSGKAVLIEGLLTFFLVFVVFAVAVDDRGAFSKVAGLPIGLVITFDILMGGLLTGAAMNPARHLGPALISGTWSASAWIYYVGPLAGGVVAAVVYYFSFLRGREVVSQPREEQPIGGGPEEDLPSS
ncbi:MAG: MIP family channel protein [Actinobacteria bacterium]|nr:MIP family channel protein [Actinomycetota bacterium]